jgi:maleamate amidohydrolase
MAVWSMEECVFDRGQTSHKVNLFDMQTKYADVVPLGDVLSYLDDLSRDLYATQSLAMPAPVEQR